LVPLVDVDGIRKTGSPRGERPVEAADVDAPELDTPRVPRRPPALADETKSALQANATTRAEIDIDFITAFFLAAIAHCDSNHLWRTLSPNPNRKTTEKSDG
jgi:hypothetical protein